ncbi:transcriptional regulator [Phenylobacterium sp. J367]|nr:M56 family metallopeptidase [Phenylobacterium sp. J367]MCR5880611.1 transcriptional regulator [Phenylobacterium sp. J367]
MTGEILAGLMRANVVAALAVGLVFLLRRPVRRAFGARVAYELWSLPLLAGLAALMPQPAAETLPFVADVGAAAGRAIPAAAKGASDLQMWLWLWLAGAAGVAAWTALRQARFVESLGRLTALGDGVWRAERADAGPAVVGAIRPRIVTPSDFEARFDAEERAVILAHERAHLSTGDGAVNALVAVAQCLCWFNPAVHLGPGAPRRPGARLRRRGDRPASGSPQALRRALAEDPARHPAAADRLPLAGRRAPLKERIVMLKSPCPAARASARGSRSSPPWPRSAPARPGPRGRRETSSRIPSGLSGRREKTS